MLIGIDQLVNAVAFGFPDETASSRLGRAVKRNKRAGEIGCAVLDALDKDHCSTSIEETATGETNAQHLGRVIRELPRDPNDRWRKTGVAILSLLLLSGCAHISEYCKQYPQDCAIPTPAPSVPPTPSPSPVVTPTPSVPSPTPTPQPTPAPTPTPKPSPTATPGGPPPLTESGNYPVPLDGCPRWFKDATARVGIRVAGQVPCQAGNVCRRVTLWATQKSVRPYCEHSCWDEAGRYALSNCRLECETVKVCQEPQFIDYVGGDPDNPGGGIVMQIKHQDWGNQWGRLDKQTCDTRNDACPPGMTNPVHNFNGHDKAVDRSGETFARACMPDGTKCSETSYRTDQ